MIVKGFRWSVTGVRVSCIDIAGRQHLWWPSQSTGRRNEGKISVFTGFDISSSGCKSWQWYEIPENRRMISARLIASSHPGRDLTKQSHNSMQMPSALHERLYCTCRSPAVCHLLLRQHKSIPRPEQTPPLIFLFLFKLAVRSFLCRALAHADGGQVKLAKSSQLILFLPRRSAADGSAWLGNRFKSERRYSRHF